jgi:hypothetical protein
VLTVGSEREHCESIGMPRPDLPYFCSLYIPLRCQLLIRIRHRFLLCQRFYNATKLTLHWIH